MQLTSEQLAALDRTGRPFTDLGGLTFGEFVQEQILDMIESGAIGITADARDVNAVALAGVVARRDVDTAPGTSLLFAWDDFRFHNGESLVLVAGDSLTLAASSINYVEVDRAGTVSANTTSFTAGSFPLWQVTTGATDYDDENVLGRATPYTLVGLAGIKGSLLSTAAKTKELDKDVGTVATAAGTTKFTLRVPSTVGTATITKISFVTKDALAASDTNYVDFGVVNKGAAGAGSTAVVDRTSAANSTKVTGGTALAAYTPRDLVIASPSVTGGDVLSITLTVTGTLANTLTESSLLVELAHTN